MQGQRLLPIAINVGKLMLECGAEIYRVEESIIRICKAYGAKSVEVFAIPSSIIVTLNMDGDEFITLSKRVFVKETDLDKMDKLNGLSRLICSSYPEADEIEEKIDEIMNSKVYNQPIILLAYAITPATFCFFFGGNLKDAASALIIGIIIKFTLDGLIRFNANVIFTNIICSAVGSIFAILCVRIGIADNHDKIIIGTIMLLVPGLILTNSMRSFMMGDLMAGMLLLIEALLVAIGIAIGVALILTIFGVNTFS